VRISSFIRRAFLCSLLAGAGAACWPAAKQPVARSATAASARIYYEPTQVTVISRPDPNQRILAFPSLREAFEFILANAHPLIVSVGEVHKEETSNITSTAQLFARDALPLLVGAGYHDFIVEFFPYGKKGEKDLEEFYRTGRLSQYLESYIIGHTDYCGKMGFLQQVRALRAQNIEVNIHGIHFHVKDDNERARGINEQMRAVIQSFEGKKLVVSYTGAQHNNIIPVPGQEYKSNGQALRALYGDNFVEVDIYHPDFIRISEVPPSHIALDDLENLIPTSGVIVVYPSGPAGRVVIVLPRFDQPVASSSPQPCP